MPQSKANHLWIDHLATVGIGLSLILLTTMTSAIPWFLIGGLMLFWLLWEARRWRQRSRRRKEG